MQTVNYATKMNTGDSHTINAVEYEAIAKKCDCFEWIPDTPVKVYLDVDIKRPVEDGDILLLEAPRILEGLKDCLTRFFGDNFDINQVAITECHSSRFVPYTKTEEIAKLSFGFVINNMIATKSQQKILVEKLNDFARQTMDKDDIDTFYQSGVFDSSPYSGEGTSQKIRSVYASKPNENRPKRLIQGSFEQSVITAFIPPDAIQLDIEVPPRKKQRLNAEEPQSTDTAEPNRNVFNMLIDRGLLTPYAQSGKYADWIRIGWAIKNVFDDRTLWHRFSRSGGSAYDEYECNNVWDTMQKTNEVGFGTIVHYAKQTNPEAVKQIYAEIKEQNIYEKQQLKEMAEDRQIALFFHSVFPDKVITVREQTYIYNGIHWIKTDKKYSHLQHFVSFEFVNEINAFYTYFTKKYTYVMSRETDEEKRKQIQEKITYYDCTKKKIVHLLFSQHFRQNIVKEIVLLSCSEKNDLIEFDQKPHLFAFQNCVFDLRTQQKITPNPTDYIHLTTGYDYDDNFDMALVAELEAVLKRIHPDQEVYDYFLTVMSTALTGDHLQYFVVLTGKGGNGKGVVMKLIHKTLGKYSYVLPNDVLTNEIKSGPNPAIAGLNGCRLARTSEPKKNTLIRFDTVKTLTGENEISARNCNSNDTRCLLNCLLVLEVNELGGFDETGDAVYRRVRSIPFMTSAVSQQDYEEAEDKKYLNVLDTSLDSEEWREKYKQAYFHILLKYLPAFYSNKKDLPPMPKACQDKTNEHLALGDDIHLWIETLLEEDPDNYEIIPLKDLYEMVKDLDTFHELSKLQKRKYNYKYFTTKMQDNRKLRKYIIEKDQRYKGKGEQVKGISLGGFKIREPVIPDNQPQPPSQK